MKLEYRTLKEKVKEYNKKDAKFYGNIFAKMSKLDHMESNVGHILFTNLNISAYFFSFHKLIISFVCFVEG